MKVLFEFWVKDLGVEIQVWTDETLNILEINILERAPRHSRRRDKITKLT